MLPAGTVWLLALMAGADATVPAPVVKVERHAGVFRIEAEMSVKVDPATAWGVLTDYNHLAEFMPDMRESRIVSGPGEPVLVEQKAMTGFLVFRFPIEVVLKVEESPCSRVAFQAVKGNVKELRGEWRVAGDRSPVTILYATHLEPDFWVPPLVGPALIRADVEAQMIGLAREMVRRKEQRVRSIACASGTAGP